MEDPNAAQLEYWSGPGGQRWIAARDRLDAHLAPITRALFEPAAPHVGERALDIGCGCGHTTRELARRTGARAVGLDLSPTMIDTARATPGGDAVTWIAADASTYKLAPEHDLMFSRFGVMFFADPVAAFAHLRTALAPGARLAFACWRALELNAWAGAPLAAARPLLPRQPPPDPHAPGPFAFADGDRVRAILVRAGWRDIVVEPLDSVMAMGPTLDGATDEAMQIGPLARQMSELDDATRAQIRERVRGAYARFVSGDGVRPPAAVWLVGAK